MPVPIFRARLGKIGVLFASTLVGVSLAGCSSGGSSKPPTDQATSTLKTSAPGVSASSSSTVSSAPDEHQVAKADLGADWPLTVGSGELNCYGSGGVGSATFTSPDGTEYALNGTAKSKCPEIDSLLSAGDIPGTKKDIGPLIDRALKLCK
jgi:hypothetical protein